MLPKKSKRSRRPLIRTRPENWKDFVLQMASSFVSKQLESNAQSIYIDTFDHVEADDINVSRILINKDTWNFEMLTPQSISIYRDLRADYLVVVIIRNPMCSFTFTAYIGLTEFWYDADRVTVYVKGTPYQARKGGTMRYRTLLHIFR